MASQPDLAIDAAQTGDAGLPPAAPPAPVPAKEAIDPAEFYREDKREPVVADTAEGAQQPGEGQPEPEAPEGETAQPPIPRPHAWNNDQEEMWKALPRNVQEVMASREVERERFVHSKAQEAARARQTVEQEARAALAQVAQSHAQQLQQALQMANLPQPPNPELLNSDDPEHHRLYMVQQNRYNAATDQAATLHRSAELARQQAEHLQSQERQLAIQADEAKLVEKWPEWSEPSKRAERLAQLAPIAAELGYGPEEQAQAASTDLFALHTAYGWKAKADKYDAMMKRQMEPVRAAKQAPPATRVAAPANGSRQPVDASALLYPEDQPRR